MQSRCISNIQRFVVALTISLMLAFMPFSVNLQSYRITLERSEALASDTSFAGAMSFLEECSTALGEGEAGAFIAVGAGLTSVITGYSIGNSSGIKLSNSASDNLNALIDTDDYPSWESLSSAQQSSWRTKDNYNAAKFNSLMSAYGLSEDYENYKTAWGNGNAENFQFSSTGQTSLQKIAEIGDNWINGAGNTIDSILSLGNFNKQQIVNWFPLEKGTCSKSENDTDWPAGLPETVYYTINAEYQIGFNNGTDKVRYQKFSSPVYSFSYINGSNISYVNCSLNQYTYGYRNDSPEVTLDGTPTSETYGDVSFYSNRFSVNSVTSNPIPDNGDISNVMSNASNRRYICAKILTGGVMSGGPVEVSGYPEQEIENDTYDPDIVITFPSSGISDETTWNELVQHSQNIDGDLDSVIALLQHIDSDLHNLNIPGATDLTPIINKLQSIDTHIQALDLTPLITKLQNIDNHIQAIDLSNVITKLQTIDTHIQNLDYLKAADLQPLITLLQHVDSDLHKFTFINGDTLKVHDGATYTELENIYNVLVAIAQKLKNWGDIADASDLIGDFDFDELDEKVPDLLETISDLAPFGSILLLSEMYSIMANYTQIQTPELIFPFDFGGFDEQNHELVIDLSWLDDIKPLINFLCIAMLVIAIANATIRIVEIEAAS